MFEGHPARITQLAFQHRGDYLVSGDEEGYVLLWDPRRNTDPVGGEVFESDVSRLAWSGNDDCLAVGQRCGAVSVLRFANANGK
jgi:WD40 repeat protein